MYIILLYNYNILKNNQKFYIAIFFYFLNFLTLLKSKKH